MTKLEATLCVNSEVSLVVSPGTITLFVVAADKHKYCLWGGVGVNVGVGVGVFLGGMHLKHISGPLVQLLHFASHFTVVSGSEQLGVPSV